MTVLNKFCLLPFLVLLVAFSSCIREMDVKPQQGKRLLVLNAMLRPSAKEQNTFSVANSLLFTDKVPLKSEHKSLENCSISLKINNQEVAPGNDEGVRYIPKELNPGDEISFSVSAPGYDPITARTIVPPYPKIGEIKTIVTDDPVVEEDEAYVRNEVVKVNAHYKLIRLQIPIQDIANEDNYYRVQGSKELMKYVTNEEGKEEEGRRDTRSIEIKDPIIETPTSTMPFLSGYSYNLFSDRKFKNASYSMEIKIRAFSHFTTKEGQTVESDYVDYKDWDRLTVRLCFYSLTSDLYKFWKSMEIFSGSQRNPLAEPAQVFSNVQNGLGILGSFAPVYKEIKIIRKDL